MLESAAIAGAGQEAILSSQGLKTSEKKYVWEGQGAARPGELCYPDPFIRIPSGAENGVQW